MVWHS